MDKYDEDLFKWLQNNNYENIINKANMYKENIAPDNWNFVDCVDAVNSEIYQEYYESEE